LAQYSIFSTRNGEGGMLDGVLYRATIYWFLEDVLPLLFPYWYK